MTSCVGDDSLAHSEVRDRMRNATGEDWVEEIVDLLMLDERSVFDRLLRRGVEYECLPVFGGVLLRVSGQGVVWLPRSYIDGLLSKAGLRSVVIQNFGLLFSFTIPGGGLLSLVYDFFKDRVWKKPPAEPRQYLPHMIDRVEYGSLAINRKKINMVAWAFRLLSGLIEKKEKRVTRAVKWIRNLVKKEEKAEEQSAFCVYFLRFIDRIAVAKQRMDFTSRAVKKFQRVPTFKCRHENDLSKFVRGLENDGFRVMKAP